MVRKVGLELGAEVIRQRARGQRFVQIIGGKALHPVTALPGGMSKRVTKEEQQEFVRRLPGDPAQPAERVGGEVVLVDAAVTGGTPGEEAQAKGFGRVAARAAGR